MKRTNIILLSITALFALSGCNDTPSSPEAKTYTKTSEEVYQQSCVKCHGKNGEGNTEKKSPALNDRQAGELELDLYDVKNGGTNQSSGTAHDIMEHNMQKLMAKGYDYDPKSMAEYIEKSFFNKESLNTEATPIAEPEAATPEVAVEPVAEATPAPEATPATPATEATPASE